MSPVIDNPGMNGNLITIINKSISIKKCQKLYNTVTSARKYNNSSPPPFDLA